MPSLIAKKFFRLMKLGHDLTFLAKLMKLSQNSFYFSLNLMNQAKEVERICYKIIDNFVFTWLLLPTPVLRHGNGSLQNPLNFLRQVIRFCPGLIVMSGYQNLYATTLFQSPAILVVFLMQSTSYHHQLFRYLFLAYCFLAVIGSDGVESAGVTLCGDVSASSATLPNISASFKSTESPSNMLGIIVD